MKNNKTYQTNQKSLILSAIKTHENSFTVKDIYLKLNMKVGLTTIYRYINMLLNDGIINKEIGNDNIIHYQYLEKCEKENHFFLRCNICGKTIHIDCECIENLSSHMLKTHRFIPDRNNFIINGLCEKCKNNLNKKGE